jgi:hypothetical protein
VPRSFYKVPTAPKPRLEAPDAAELPAEDAAAAPPEARRGAAGRAPCRMRLIPDTRALRARQAAVGDAAAGQAGAASPWETFDSLFEDEGPKARPARARRRRSALFGRGAQPTLTGRSPAPAAAAQREPLAPPPQFAQKQVVCARCYALEHYGCAQLPRAAQPQPSHREMALRLTAHARACRRQAREEHRRGGAAARL